MGYTDDSDLELLVWLSDFRTPGSALVSLIFIAICAGVVYCNHDECNDHCSPQSGRLIDHECYCVQPDGSLKVEPKDRK